MDIPGQASHQVKSQELYLMRCLVRRRYDHKLTHGVRLSSTIFPLDRLQEEDGTTGAWVGVGRLSRGEFQKASVMERNEESFTACICFMESYALHFANEEMGPETLEKRFG